MKMSILLERCKSDLVIHHNVLNQVQFLVIQVAAIRWKCGFSSNLKFEVHFRMAWNADCMAWNADGNFRVQWFLQLVNVNNVSKNLKTLQTLLYVTTSVMICRLLYRSPLLFQFSFIVKWVCCISRLIAMNVFYGSGRHGKLHNSVFCLDYVLLLANLKIHFPL